ncbi:sugar ABC transporter substrate-binding protein [Brevibacillus ruminantium]|uniref:Sugar ABC transporter substrate-binding protein n=1 Tax=Brevibacillus ruminantium TaxID=2950604 RepID=A0ABY4WIH2_9BACL|nr:sugar ABC transporter substrate-binding protein [Brevibacillus ruminantium]USG66912.1 sugar ABC transporter substrate-binding protein [Brevibacillus ruminantium]
MKRKRRLSLFSSALLSAALLLSACSGSGQQANTGEQPSATNNQTKTEQIELKMGYYSDPPTQKKMEELLAKFMAKNPHIKITTETGPHAQFFQKLNTQIAGGNAPDLWLSDGVKVFEFAERGALKDLKDLIDKDLNKDDYYGMDANKGPGGEIWGVPQGVQIGVLYYNKALFDKAGVKYPDATWTWDQVKEAAELLTIDASGKNAKDPAFDATKVSEYGFTIFSSPVGVSRGWFPLMKTFGGGVLDQSLQKAVLDTPENKQAVEWMVDGMKKGIFPDPVDLQSFQDPFKPFLSGVSGMQIDIYAARVKMRESGLNFDVAPLPAGPGGKRFAPSIVNSWVISKKADDKKTQAAWEWIKYWATDDEAQREWASLGEAIPVKKKVAEEVLNSDTSLNAKVYLDSMEFAGSLDANAVFGEWRKAFDEQMFPVFSGEASVEQGLKNANAAVQKVLDEFYKK